jgi:regulator of protease activity HflC (stomatin/prohibitin superfamily)
MLQERKGKNVALFGAAVQLLCAIVLLLLWQYTRSVAAMSTLWLLAGGLPAWLIAALIFYARELKSREQLELDEIARTGGGQETLFTGEQGEPFHAASRRLRLIERYLVPAFTLLWAGYHGVIGGVILRDLTRAGTDVPAIEYATQGALFGFVVGFLTFLFSFYALGMGRRLQWRPLRACGSYTLFTVAAVGGVCVSLLSAWQGYPAVDRVVALVLPAVQVLFALELLANLVMDLFRPRVPGKEQRLSFDSRIFGLFADPRRLGSNIAETLNYQFGFEVSGTWFYRLLARAFLPLAVFAAGVMLAMSSIVIAEQGEEYIVQRWGRVDPGRPTRGAGISFKWPWPVETAERFDTGRVRQLLVGAAGERSAEQQQANLVNGQEIFLWTNEHGNYIERDFLLAVPPKLRDELVEDANTPAVNVIKLVIAVDYRVADPYAWGYHFADAEQVLRNLSYNEMTSYCAAATLDRPLPGEEDRPQAIMTSGRGDLAAALQRRIRDRAETLELGVEILNVDVVSVHPPAQAAPAYEEVLQAERSIVGARYMAEARANELLSSVAGDPATGLQLAFAISSLGDFVRLRDLAGAENETEFRAALQQMLHARREDIKKLTAEILTEQLEGRGREGGDQTSRERLQQRYLAHVAALQRLLDESEAARKDLDEQIRRTRERIEALMQRVQGEPAERLARARARRWSVNQADRDWLWTFRRGYLSYRAAPRVYLAGRWLDLWDELLPDAFKFVLAVPNDNVEVRYNLEREDVVYESITEEIERAANR